MLQSTPGFWGTLQAKYDPIVDGDCNNARVLYSCLDGGKSVVLLRGESRKDSRALWVANLTLAVEEALVGSLVLHNMHTILHWFQ